MESAENRNSANLKNLTFNHMLDGIFSHVLEEKPEFISVENAGQDEVATIQNTRVQVKISRPTLDSQDSEAWQAPWDANVKLRMRLDLKRLDNDQFSFRDVPAKPP